MVTLMKYSLNSRPNFERKKLPLHKKFLTKDNTVLSLVLTYLPIEILMYKIVPKKGWSSPKFCRWKLIRCVFIIMRMIRPLHGLPVAAWAAIPQAHARRTVGHLEKKNIYAQLDNWGRTTAFFWYNFRH